MQRLLTRFICNVHKTFIICFQRIHTLFINIGYDVTVSDSESRCTFHFFSSFLEGPRATGGL